MDPKVVVNYPCSKCEAPIQLDAGFSHLSEHTKAELALPVFRGHEFLLPAECDLESACIDKIISPFTFSNEYSGDGDPVLLHTSNITGSDRSKYAASEHGYTVLGCPTGNNKNNNNNNNSNNNSNNNVERTPALRVMSELLDLASTNSTVDHPMCEECTDALLQQVETQLQFTAEKSRSYNRLLEELQLMPVPDTEHLEAQLQELEEEEASLEATVKELVEEQRQIEEQLKEKQREATNLADEAERYQIEYCKQRSLWLDADEERISFHNQKVYSQQQLEKLKQTNIFNIAFHIWKDDHICTINNFRLGRLPTMQVSWPEINAALGQMALLLVALTRKLNISFTKYKIVPYGNHSYIEALEQDNRVLPLYTHSGIKYFLDHSFDQAMVAFLECFVEVAQHLEQMTGAPISLPYPVVKACLEDPQGGGKYSIKTQFNPDEQWTKAVKFLLTNLKWMLTWASAPTLAKLVPAVESGAQTSSMMSSARSLTGAAGKGGMTPR